MDSKSYRARFDTVGACQLFMVIEDEAVESDACDASVVSSSLTNHTIPTGRRDELQPFLV